MSTVITDNYFGMSESFDPFFSKKNCNGYAAIFAVGITSEYLLKGSIIVNKYKLLDSYLCSKRSIHTGSSISVHKILMKADASYV